MTYKKKTLFFEGAKITYFVEGESKDAIIYCHGDAQNHTAGKTYLELFQGKRITIDLPGHGHSEDLTHRTLDSELELLDEIIQKENVRRVLLIGHSHGAAIALSYAIKNKTRAIVFDPLLADPKKIFGPKLIGILEESYLEGAKGKYAGTYHEMDCIDEKELREKCYSQTPYETLEKNLRVYEGYDIRDKLENADKILIIQSSNKSPISTREHIENAITENITLKIVDGTHNTAILNPGRIIEIIKECWPDTKQNNPSLTEHQHQRRNPYEPECADQES